MSFILSAGGTSNSVNMTAAGTIAAGQPCIVTAAGTAAQVGTTGTGTSFTANASLVGPGAGYSGYAYMPAQLSYITASNQNVIVGTYGSAGFVWGSATQYSAAAADVIDVLVLPGTSRFVVVYFAPTTGFPTAVVGTVSGASVTFGTPVTIQAVAGSGGDSFACVVSATQFALIWATFNAGSVNTAACSVSGTVISAGAVTSSALTAGISSNRMVAVWHANASRVVFAFGTQVVLGCDYLVASISGNTLTYGAVTNLSAGSPYWPVNVLYDPLRFQILLDVQISGNFTLDLYNLTGGTTLTGVTSAAPLINGASNLGYDTTNNLILEARTTFIRSITNSGTVLTLNATNTTGIVDARPLWDATNAQVAGIAGANAGVAKYGTTNLGTGNYIGIATNAASAGGTVTINTIGNTATLTGLTPGSNYAVLNIGGLAPVTTLTLGTYAGVAISNATLLLKG